MNDQKQIPRETQNVVSSLKQHHLTYKLLLFKPEQTRTSSGAAKAVGCELSQICKSIAIITEKGTPVIVMTAGHNRVNLQKMSDLLGEKARLMKPREVKQLTGYEVGGVPPIGHITEIKMYMDEDLLKHDKIYAAGGTANSIIELDPEALQKATNASIINVK